MTPRAMIPTDMPRHPIGQGWTLDLPDDFAYRQEGTEHVFWHGGRTVYAVVYNTTGGDAEAALAEMASSRGVKPLERFADHPGQSSTAAEAWLTDEQDDTGQHYLGLNTYTATPASVACVTVYFPTRDNLPWALSLWHSVHPPAPVTQHS